MVHADISWRFLHHNPIEGRFSLIITDSTSVREAINPILQSFFLALIFRICTPSNDI